MRLNYTAYTRAAFKLTKVFQIDIGKNDIPDANFFNDPIYFLNGHCFAFHSEFHTPLECGAGGILTNDTSESCKEITSKRGGKP